MLSMEAVMFHIRVSNGISGIVIDCPGVSDRVFIQDGSDMTLLNRIRLLLCDESGQDAVEYAFVLLGVSLAAIATVHNAAVSIGHAYLRANTILTAAIAACMHHRPGG